MKHVNKITSVFAFWLFLLFGCAGFYGAHANNVAISNFQYLSATQEIEFDITWENSWRNTGTAGSTQNYDGVWVFAKYRHSCAKDSVQPSATSYRHVWLSSSGHVIPAGATGQLASSVIGGANRNLGVFLYRSADGSGTFSLTDVRLKWDVAAQGITGTDWDLQVFAIEMVHIPEGSFYLGDAISSYSFVQTTNSAAWGSTQPYLVNSENAITCSQTVNGSLGITSQSNTSVMQGTLPAGFPKGFAAFWSMKYEITQKQYCDFLNTLSRSSQGVLAPNTSSSLAIGNTSVPAASRGAFDTYSTQQGSYRNGIRIDGPTGNVAATIDASKPVTFVCDLNPANAGNSSDDGQSVACNYLQADLGNRFLDWTGLRPMSEMEFEKICRGPSVSPPYLQINYEGVWGVNLNVAGTMTAAGPVTNGGTATETLTVSGPGLTVASATSSPAGPRRVGITHTSSTNRSTSGSSFYGVADMGGNMSELVVSVGMWTSFHGTFSRDSVGDGNPENSYSSSWPVNSNGSPCYMAKGGDWGTGGNWPDHVISWRSGGGSSGEQRNRWATTFGSTPRWYVAPRGVRNPGTVIP